MTPKYIPILYSTSMVQAILNDRKNQTRRIKKLDTFNSSPNWWRYDGLEKACNSQDCSGRELVKDYLSVSKNH